MSHVFPRHTHIHPPLAAGGDGCYIVDASGKRYLDGSGGAAVSCLGHGDRSVSEAIKTQLDRIAFAHTGFFSSAPSEALADRLIQHASGTLDRVYFVSGGSEAMEAAMKLARQHAVERGEPHRKRFIARWQSYHGNTLGALSAGGNRSRRTLYEPLLIEMSHVDPCYEYRLRRSEETSEQYGLRAAGALETEILRLGPESVCAFIAEPVVGATLGAVPAAPGYFRRIREICDRYGILLILDEVMCGMGRTGSFYAFEQEGIAPDIVAIAKGLGAGYQPIGAMLCTKRIYETISAGSGLFQHGHTYLAHPTACAAGLAVVSAIHQRGLIERVRRRGEELDSVLRQRFGRHPHVGNIRGRGLLRGLELVADHESKAPFAPERQIHAKIKRAALDAGLICYPMGGTVDGRNGDHVLLAPPFIIETAQIDELVDKLAGAIDTALAA